MTLYPDNEKSRKEPNKIKYTTWDIETDYPNNPMDVLLVSFYNGKDYRLWEGKDNIDFFLGETLRKKYYGYSHYAHFGGKFDFLYMMDKLNKYDINYDIIDVNGRILELTCKFHKYYDIDKETGEEIEKYKDKIMFRDSYAIMPKSLKDLSTSFNVEHRKIDKNWFEPTKPNYTDKFENWDLFKEYLKYDTLGLYECISHFENIINSYGGEVKLTVASTSLDIFKHKYLKTILNSLTDITKHDDNTIIKVEDIIRNYYFGGRTEIFKRYGEYLHYYDVNSLYPYVMLNKMPISQPYYMDLEDLNLKSDSGFVYCDIGFHNPDIIPLIPYKLKMKSANKLIYPMGNWSAWLDLDMYRKAVEIGYDINVHHGIVFNTDYIFNDFIKDFYALRSESDSLKTIGKLILNSLYGKWAQKREKKQIIKYLGMDIKYICDNLKVYNLEKNLYEKISISTSKHIIPSISAHITTLSQLELYKHLEKCGKDNIYYCDTDSIITSEKLPTGKNLGELKEEYEINRGCFLLPKTYCIDGYNTKTQETEIKMVMKGFMKNTFKFEDFYNAIMTNDLSKFSYNINKIWGYKESMKKNNSFLTYADKKNSIKTIYDKRIILDNHIDTKPLTIQDGIII